MEAKLSPRRSSPTSAKCPATFEVAAAMTAKKKRKRSAPGSEAYGIDILSQFRSRYLRNNKRAGLKNLRCFPECLPSGHKQNVFCGHCVTVLVRSDVALQEASLVVGRFSTDDNAKPEDSALVLKRNGKIDRNDVVSRTRSRENPTKEFIVAERVPESESVDGDGKYKVVFRFAPRGWHYGYFGSKHNRGQLHSFYCFLLTPPKKRGSKMFCMATTKSTPFSMISSKRASGGHEPLRQHIVVTEPEVAAQVKLLEQRGQSRLTKRQRVGSKLAKDAPTLSTLRLEQCKRLLLAVRRSGDKNGVVLRHGREESLAALRDMFSAEHVVAQSGQDASVSFGEQNHQALLVDMAKSLLENEDLLRMISKCLSEHEDKYETTQHSHHAALVDSIGQAMDKFFSLHSKSCREVFTANIARIALGDDLDSHPSESANLGLWVLSACIPDLDDEAGQSSSQSNTVSANAPYKAVLKKVFMSMKDEFDTDGHFVDKTEPADKKQFEDLMSIAGLPWISRKLSYFFYKHMILKFKWDDQRDCPVIYLTVSMNGVVYPMTIDLYCDSSPRSLSMFNMPSLGSVISMDYDLKGRVIMVREMGNGSHLKSVFHFAKSSEDHKTNFLAEYSFFDAKNNTVKKGSFVRRWVHVSRVAGD